MDPQVSLPVVGIDVSKASLAVCYQAEHQVRHLEVSNTKAGFEQLLQANGANCLFVMEATGAYYLLNSLEALTQQPIQSSGALKQLQQTLHLLGQQQQLVEQELLSLLEKRYAQELALLCSIPGIGRKTAALLLLFAGGFTTFDNYRQLIAKAGLSPREHTSGTSIRGKVSITKMGGGLIRSKLYMCSLSAKRGNAACRALYERLVARGKNGKVALIAVCTKLLKQAFAIIKSGMPYRTDFTSNLA
nr:hypothetical protein [Tanacetum cinerariifolium]